MARDPPVQRRSLVRPGSFSAVHPHPSRPADALFDERLTVALSKGRNQVHGTGGLGLTLGRHLEFNAAFDIAPTVRIFSSSLILR